MDTTSAVVQGQWGAASTRGFCIAALPGQIPDSSVTAGCLQGLGPLTELPGSVLTEEELKYVNIRNLGATIIPVTLPGGETRQRGSNL